MLTIFSIPKSFEDPHIDIIQRNAIQSWKKLHPDVEVILFGDEMGVEEVADEYDILHIPSIKKNQYGTPTLDFIFRRANDIAKNQLLCYVNADIVFSQDIITAISKIAFNRYLLIGQRMDIDINKSIDFSDEHWEEILLNYVTAHWNQKYCGGMDYFLFPRNALGDIPPFAVGRGGWDNWFIYNARKQKIPVIDGSNTIRVIHQNHGYSHVKDKQGSQWEGPETDHNIGLAGHRNHLWQISDADWILDGGSLRKTPFRKEHIYKKIVLLSPRQLYPAIDAFMKIIMKESSDDSVLKNKL